MNWQTRMQLVIEYIEANLQDELNIEKVANIACSSKFHFHRMFFSYFNVTFAEYVRRRRLTLAANEVISGKQKIIDIAANHGYDSPNAFTRSFKKIHGLNPSEARKKGKRLSAYHRATVNNFYAGENKLDYKIVTIPEFTILGKSKEFNFDQFVKEGPKFWKSYVGTDEYKKLLDITNGHSGKHSKSPLVSAYFPQENGSRDRFYDVLGVEVPSDFKSTEFERYKVPEATYAEFECTYKTSMKTNREIYGKWFSATGYERDNNKPDIAAYFPKTFRPISEIGIRWWIPIITK